MDQRVPPFQTNAPAMGEADPVPPSIWRMKVTALSPGGNTKLVTAVMCNYDGSTAGTKTYTVAVARNASNNPIVNHAVNDLIFVVKPQGGTNITVSSRPVALLELLTGTMMFPVQVQQDGGSDGSKTTVANWTYTVKTLDGTSLGTGISQTRPRPNGKMIYQAGTFSGSNAGYGTGFFASDGTFKLWDSGEVPSTGSC